MAVTVTNTKTSFDADTNADIPVDIGAGAAGVGTQRVILASDQAALAVTGAGFATLSDNSQNVTTAGTRVQLSAVACKKIIITAKAANTGTIWVGGSTIAANRGIPLVALQNVTLEVSNVSAVYIDSTVNGEGITYAYLS